MKVKDLIMPKFCAHCFILLIMCVLFLLPVGGSADEKPAEPPVRITFKRAAVASFLVGRRQPELNETADQTLSCSLKRMCADDPSIKSNAGITLTRLVDQQLGRRFGNQVLPREDVKVVENGLHLDRESDTPLSMAQALGKALDVDVVMLGTVWRYRDRSVQPGMPDSNASVAFAVYFVEVATGRILWYNTFDQTQKTLMSNLLEAKKQMKLGLKWLSADELAERGVQEMFSQFPDNILPGNFKQ